MTRTANNSRGSCLARRLTEGRQEAQRALRLGARRLPILRGINPQCQFFDPQENVLAVAGQFLADSNRVFRYGNSIVLAMDDGEQTIRPLATARRAEGTSSSLLSNLFICEMISRKPDVPPIQFPPPPRFVELSLNHEPTLLRLPEINIYATRPVFDSEFRFRGPGWHDDVGYLIHGPHVEPYVPDRVLSAECARDRLPPRLRGLLSDFCFRSAADLVNAVAVLLTGLLVPLFLRPGKPMILLDGNQPGVGKTLLARVLGVIFDGSDPEAIHFTTDDEELGKRICANLRGKPTSVVLIDNAKVRAGGDVSSPVIEANSMAPQISLRILGQSANYRRPNDLLWFLTMNLTKTSPDLVSRGLPIRFHHEGDPGEREFGGRDPLEYAEQHRQEILGELAGMVIVWNQHGRPPGTKRHRLSHWAMVIGGILDANGLVEFLDNVGEAASEFNTALETLAALAEAALRETRDGFVRVVTAPPEGGALDTSAAREEGGPIGHPANAWETVFRSADVLTDELANAKSQRGKATRIGSFLGQHQGRDVPIEQDGNSGTAQLRIISGRARQKLYFFEIRGDAACGTQAVPRGVELSDGLGPPTTNPPADEIRESQGEHNTPTSHTDRPEDGNQEDWG